MNITKNDILIKLIKSIDADVPSVDFTDTLMEQLQINAELDLASDESFADLVNFPNIDMPSPNFTDGIISKLEPKLPLANYQPIISKKAGWIFVLTMLVLVTLSFVTNKNSGSTIPVSSGFDAAYKTMATFFHSFTQEVSTVILCLVSLSVLLSIDYIYKKRIL